MSKKTYEQMRQLCLQIGNIHPSYEGNISSIIDGYPYWLKERCFQLTAMFAEYIDENHKDAIPVDVAWLLKDIESRKEIFFEIFKADSNTVKFYSRIINALKSQQKKIDRLKKTLELLNDTSAFQAQMKTMRMLTEDVLKDC